MVHDIGDDLGVGLEGALIAEHLNKAPVGVVGGDLPVVHHRPVQQGEGVRPAPPAGGVGGIAAVGRPAVALVFVQAVEFAHVLGEAHGLEGAHVLAAGEDVTAVQRGVDVHDRAHDVLPLVELHGRQHGLERGDEVAPDHGLVCDGGHLPGGDQLRLDDLEPILEEGLAVFSGGAVVKKHVQRVKIPVLRIDAVRREAAAESVGAVVHRAHGPNDPFPGHAPAFPGDHGRDGAAGGDPNLSFFHHAHSAFPNNKKSAPPGSRGKRLCLCAHYRPPSAACQVCVFEKND